MKRLTLLILSSLFLITILCAQKIENWIDSKKPLLFEKTHFVVYKESNSPDDTLSLKPYQVKGITNNLRLQKQLLFEKIYLHIDRELYTPGDQIWMKAYQVNGINHHLNTNFRNIYVQMIAENGHIVRDILLFSTKGQAYGDFSTDSLPGGMYTIRAFTKYLENFGEDTYFHKKIWIAKSCNPAEVGAKDSTDYSKIEISFLPECGNMVPNAINTVAFKAIDSKGKGIYVSGKILNDLGDTIVPFSSAYLGMGKFQIMPLDEITYYAVIDQNPEMRIKLEPAMPDAIHLNYSDEGGLARFTISSNMLLDRHRQFYFVASCKGNVLLYKKIEMADYIGTLNLSKDLFPIGISKITLLDSNLKQLAERLIFINDSNPDLIKLQPRKQEFKPREEVTIGAEALPEPGDSINSTLSVAVVNKNYFGTGGNSQNLKSYLLLDSELKGTIEMPSLYFIEDELISSSEKLDLLMMVNGWRTYIWNDIEAAKTIHLVDWNDAGIIIKGFANNLLRNNPLVKADLTMVSSGEKFTLGKTTTNEQGRFDFERIYLKGKTRVMIIAKTKSRTGNAEIKLDSQLKNDSVVSPEFLKKVSFDVGLNKNFNRDNYLPRMKEREFNPEKWTITLPSVDIVKKKTVTDDGHFRLYANPDNSLTVTREDNSFRNVFEYLEGKVAGLVISDDPSSLYRISIRGGKLPIFMIDGFEVIGFPPDIERSIIEQISNIHMNEIDKVEIIKSGGNVAIFGSKGGNGVIAIYRKTRDSVKYADNYEKGRIETVVKGFHEPQKFYSPSYTPDNIDNPKPDYRPTLFWNPEFNIESGKANISFYTSDQLGDYLVFVEGISKNGKILLGTSSFTVSQK